MTLPLGRGTFVLVTAALIGVGMAYLYIDPCRLPPEPLPQVEMPNWPVPPPSSGAFRITVFGTSLTAAGSWDEALGQKISACFGRPVEITRVAQHDMGSSWGLTRLDQVSAANPDLVLIEFSVNDADWLDGVSLSQSHEQHDRILAELRQNLPGTVLVLMTMNPVSGIQKILRSRLADYYALYPGLAHKHGTGFVDLTAHWLEAMAGPDWPRDAIPDGLHPRPGITQKTIVPVLFQALSHETQDCSGSR